MGYKKKEKNEERGLEKGKMGGRESNCCDSSNFETKDKLNSLVHSN